MADFMRFLGDAGTRILLDHIPTRVALIGRDGRYLYVNAENAAFLGRNADSVPGLKWAEVIGPGAYQASVGYAHRVLAGETVSFESWVHYDNRGDRYIRGVYTPYRGRDGTVDGYFIFSRDMTQLKHDEAELARQMVALQASEAMKSAVIASALDCIVVINADGGVVDFNPAAEQTFGYARAEIVGRPVIERIVPPHLRPRLARRLQRALAAGQTGPVGRRVEFAAMHADGRVFPVELALSAVALSGRRLFTAYIRDLTAVKAAEAAIARQQAELQQSEKMAAVGSLLAGVAHELNNPLAIVIGNALMLREDAADLGEPGLEERARIIEAAADRCGRIVRTFLAMARQRKTALRPLALGKLVTGAVDLLAYGLRSDSITVTFDLPGMLPAVMGDADQLNQVLVNLITNAHQALAEIVGRRCLHIAAREDGDWVVVTVADNGPGVPPILRRRIFDPFFTTKPIGAGAGIGLAVSSGIVAAHGGTLTLVESESGACFEIRLKGV